MTADENTTIIPAFSDAVFAPLKFMPADRNNPEVHAMRCDLLMKALDSHFFGGKMFIFKDRIFSTYPHWRDKDTGRPIFFLDHEPDAYGYATKEEALTGVQALIASWGFEDFKPLYNGSPGKTIWLHDNQYEALFDIAMRKGIAAKFGEAVAKKAGRQRSTPCKGSKSALVFLDDTPVFNRLVAEGAEIWGAVRYRKAPITMTLPEGEDISFDMLVSREHLTVDLTRHFFGARTFSKAKPFTMYIFDDVEKKVRSCSLMVQVAPEVLGYKTVDEAHEGLRQLAITLGHTQDALKMNIVQTTMWTMADIEKLEANPKQQAIMFRPTRR